MMPSHAQSLKAPFAPISVLATKGGWVLLLGVDHSVNTSIHFAEKMAGRRQFVRWALEENKIIECPSFPGCSNGFNQLEMPVSGMTVQGQHRQCRSAGHPADAHARHRNRNDL